MKRLIVLLYTIACYVLFLGVFLYSITFIGDFWAERTIDSPVRFSPLGAAVTDIVLFGIFGLLHFLRSRRQFNTVWQRILPPSIERSTYVLCSSIAWGTLMYLWQPIPGSVWNVEVLALRIAAYGLLALGWITVFFSIHLLDHFELLGLTHDWDHFCGRLRNPTRLKIPLPYALVRHPLYVVWITLVWVTPAMSLGHFLFAALFTAFVLLPKLVKERKFEIFTSNNGSIGVVCRC